MSRRHNKPINAHQECSVLSDVMALRDAVGLLNGLRRVAAALYVEGASEIQHALSKSAVGTSLYETAEGVASGVSWTEEVVYCKRRGLGLGNDFPEWTGLEEGYFPVSESFPDSRAEVNSSTGLNTAVKSDAGPSSQDRIPSKSLTPPLGRGPGWNGGRQYHTLVRPRSAHHRIHGRWFHSSATFYSDTLVTTGRSSRPMDTSKAKTSTSKQKARK